MKQIFDWLREQIGKMQEIDLFTTRYINRDKVHKIINEAEAKWEADCCEWKTAYLTKYLTGCGNHTVDKFYFYETDDRYKYCPYCRKKIKIVEG